MTTRVRAVSELASDGAQLSGIALILIDLHCGAQTTAGFKSGRVAPVPPFGGANVGPKAVAAQLPPTCIGPIEGAERRAQACRAGLPRKSTRIIAQITPTLSPAISYANDQKLAFHCIMRIYMLTK